MSFKHKLLAAFWLFSQPAATQTPIQYGNTITGDIACGGANAYILTGNRGDKVVVHITETEDFGGICQGIGICGFDQCLDIHDELNELVGMVCTPREWNICDHQLRTQLGPLTLPRDGKYRISVRDTDNIGRGRYALYLQRTNSPLGSELLNMGDMRLVPIQTQGQVRAFTFNAPQDTNVRIEMKPETGGNVVPRLALYGPNGDPLALPDGGLIQFAVRQSGQHVLLVFSSVQETGLFQLKLSPGLPYPNPVVSQIADGNGWRTTLTLVNHSSEPAPFVVRSWNDAGTSWRLVWDGPTEGTIPVGGSQTINTLNRDPVTNQGWAELIAAKTIGVQAIFRSSSGQEATVAGITSMSGFLLPFDNTQEMITSLALANTNDTRGVHVRVLFRDEAGDSLGTGTITLPPRGHDAFAMPVRFPSIRGRRGVAEFSTDAPDMTGLGLRFTPGGAFTSFPVQPTLP